MEKTDLVIPQTVHDALKSFNPGTTLLAIPLRFEGNNVQALPFIHKSNAESSFQNNLSHLDDVLDPQTALYLLLRRNDSMFVITFVPYRAPKYQRNAYLHYRHVLVEALGKELFESSIICKEIGEITDARSWVERDAYQPEHKIRELIDGREDGCKEGCKDAHQQCKDVKDRGYRKNRCRLCDRRMKNEISNDALEALSKLENAGDCIQISLDTDLVLTLDLQASLPPELVSSKLPTTHPTFTLYRHPNTLLYFIFHSPDSAPVQQRMKHTMAIPGLVNVHAEDRGVHVDQKIEIHEPEDLVFDKGDQKLGRFRSVYLRGGWRGTESEYEGLERDKEFYDAVV